MTSERKSLRLQNIKIKARKTRASGAPEEGVGPGGKFVDKIFLSGKSSSFTGHL